jgi:hypothetical protein
MLTSFSLTPSGLTAIEIPQRSGDKEGDGDRGEIVVQSVA